MQVSSPMHWQPPLPDRYFQMSPDELDAAVRGRRDGLGDEVLVVAHRRQPAELVRHADVVGDSLAIVRHLAGAAAPAGLRRIVVVGAHGLAETVAVLAAASIRVIAPDLTAGGAAAEPGAMDRAWRVFGTAVAPARVVPLACLHGGAAALAFAAAHGGAACAGAAGAALDWAASGGAGPAAGDEPVEIVFPADLVEVPEAEIGGLRGAGSGPGRVVGGAGHLGDRLAAAARNRGMSVRILGEGRCPCTPEDALDLPHLLWALDHLADGRTVNEVRVLEPVRSAARQALDRMLAGAGPAPA